MWQKSYDGSPCLYLIPTPIGNMEDMTFRAINVLKEVFVIFSEDTRVTRNLLEKFEIKKNLISLHDHNEDLVKEKVKAIVCLGVDNTKLHQFFDGKVENIADASSMEEAVNKCFAFADKGDTVLLSPCCASFDLFKSYEDRGQQFKECVKRL